MESYNDLNFVMIIEQTNSVVVKIVKNLPHLLLWLLDHEMEFEGIESVGICGDLEEEDVVIWFLVMEELQALDVWLYSHIMGSLMGWFSKFRISILLLVLGFDNSLLSWES